MNETPSTEPPCHDNRRTLAIILLCVGLFALVQRYFGPDWNQLLLVGIGAAFIVASLVSRTWGLLVPGCIIIGVGAGVLARHAVEFGRAGRAGVFLICMGSGFFLITILSAIGFRKRALWAMIPGSVLVLVGAAQLLDPDYRAYFRFLNDIWPIALILAGVWLLIASSRGGRDAGN